MARILLKYLSPLISLVERLFFPSARDSDSLPQIVFIIGAPRTGSTILFQSLTNSLKVAYTTNLINYARRNLLFGFWMNRLIYKDNPHNCFRSKHGDSYDCGLNAPHESNQYWYRYFPRKHYLMSEDISDSSLSKIVSSFKQIGRFIKGPIVLKSLPAGLRIDIYSRIFPHAKYIFVQRDAISTAQSILQAREKLEIPDHHMWSIRPKGFKSLLKYDEEEMVVYQIYKIEQQISELAERLDTQNFLSVDYDEFVDSPEDSIENIRKFIGVELSYRTKFTKPEVNKRVKDSLEVQKRLKEIVSKLDWKGYTSSVT